MLPDDVLLEIFDCLRLAAATDSNSDRSDDPPSSAAGLTWSPWEWHRLAHVCRRWRSLVFASPHRLDLRLVYTYKLPARVRKKALESWPTLPITIWYPWQSEVRGRFRRLEDENNVSFALRHPDRIREINLFLTSSLLSKSGARVLASFPVLEYLRLESRYPTKPSALPVDFLGGSTPRLRDIHLTDIAFPTLPLLILSTRHLVSLRLDRVSRLGYFSPEELSIGLSMTTQLKSLWIHFLHLASSVSRDTGSAGRPLKVTAMLPALSEFDFCGDSAYLGDLISRLDTPVLERLHITFCEPSTFQTLQLSQFISRTKSLASPHQMSILLPEDETLTINQFQHPPLSQGHFQLKIIPEEDEEGELDMDVSLPQILTRLSALLSSVQRLDMKSFSWSPWLGLDDLDSMFWRDVFCHLKSVTRLSVDGEILAQSIKSALEQLPEEMVRRVLPALHDLHVGDCQTSGPFEKFATARQFSGRPLNVYYVAYLPPPDTGLDESSNGLNVES